MRKRGARTATLLAALFVAAAGCASEKAPPAFPTDALVASDLFALLERVVAVPTFRGAPRSERDVVEDLAVVKRLLDEKVATFNAGQTVDHLTPFEWTQPVAGESRRYWVFGYRLGRGATKLALVCHLDTVPPGDDQSWTPFALHRERRAYGGDPAAEFYVGRGSIDDKGPAVVGLLVLEALARRFDGDAALDDVTIELAFDTSEETDFSYSHYVAADPAHAPAFGVIHDAFWIIRAEKGIERPVFRVAPAPAPPGGVWVERLDTPAGPVNQIPDSATAVLRATTPGPLRALAAEIEELYRSSPFDDPGYRRAALTVDRAEMPAQLRLTTFVAGAQHGSAPEENRAGGANPLVSLTSFLAALGRQGRLAPTPALRLSEFAAWAFGTRVFGEHQPDLLARHDDVFRAGNGTTYALTRFQTSPDANTGAALAIDVRYAIGHHPSAWDGVSEGFLPGDQSLFASQVLPALVGRFNQTPGAPIAFTTFTAAPPDIRRPDGPALRRVQRACAAVLGAPCTARAIGGGTDAKGHPQLVAAGALFGGVLGPPINFHGVGEGAPVDDLRQSARILFHLFADEIGRKR